MAKRVRRIRASKVSINHAKDKQYTNKHLNNNRLNARSNSPSMGIHLHYR